MNLKKLWFMPGLRLKIKFGLTREQLAKWIASRLPLRIRYHVTMNMLSEATKDVQATELVVMTVPGVLKSIPKPKNVY